MQGLLFDQDLNLIKETDGDNPVNKFPDLLGSSIKDGTYTLYFSNNSHKSLTSVSYDFDQKTSQQNGVDLTIKKEQYIGALTYKNKFYFITVPKQSSTIKLYIFDSPGHYSVRIYDFPKEHFMADDTYFKLSDALADNPVVIIDNEIPNSIDLTSSLIKLYCFDDKIVFTLNTTLTNTRIITIDVNSLEGSVKAYHQPEINHKEFANVSANSYIYDLKLYQMKDCNDEMAFAILDLKSEQTIKEYGVHNDEEITFSNTPIIQEKDVPTLIKLSDGERVLSKTKQFLRKVASSNAGINAYKVSSGIEVTLGGYKKIQRGAPMSVGGSPAMGAGGSYTPFGMVPIAQPVYNPTYTSYNTYTATKSVYFKSLFNEESFEHKVGTLNRNSFDKMKALKEEIDSKTTANTVFKKDGYLILGYYLKNEAKYVMRKFQD